MRSNDFYTRGRLETAASMVVINHYRKNGVLYGWDRFRYERLCKTLGVTPYELGRICCIFHTPSVGVLPSHALVHRYLKDNHFPPMAVLQLAQLEVFAQERIAARSGKTLVLEPIVPIHELLSTPPREHAPQHD